MKVKVTATITYTKELDPELYREDGCTTDDEVMAFEAKRIRSEEYTLSEDGWGSDDITDVKVEKAKGG